MIVTSSVVLFVSSFLRSKYFFVNTEVVVYQTKSVVICIIIKGLNGGFIYKKILVAIDFKGFQGILSIGNSFLRKRSYLIGIFLYS